MTTRINGSKPAGGACVPRDVPPIAGCAAHKSLRREPGDCDVAYEPARPHRNVGRTPGGVASGVAFVPQVPGLAPGACMRDDRFRVAIDANRRSGSQSCLPQDVSPIRDVPPIKAPGASRGTATWCTHQRGHTETWGRLRAERIAGWPLFPKSPGSRPGLVCGTTGFAWHQTPACQAGKMKTRPALIWRRTLRKKFV